jgi:hypothetical protein
MQWVRVTQWVRTGEVHIPPDQSLASRSGGQATCTPSKGRTQREGTRRSAAGGSPARGRVVVHRLCRKRPRGQADGVPWPEGRRPGRDKARVQETTGGCERGRPAEGGLGNVGAPMGAL